MNEENKMWLSDIEYPYQFSGFTVHETHMICNKCNQRVERGIINVATHWNDCIDGGKTISALTALREEKGSALTVIDIEDILKSPTTTN